MMAALLTLASLCSAASPAVVAAQGPSILVQSAPAVTRGIKWLRALLVSYVAGKGIDAAIGEGKAVALELSRLEQRLRSEELARAADRALITRQIAMVIELKETVDRLLVGSTPSAEERAGVERRIVSWIGDLQRIQEDHGQRIGRLEEGLDSLRYVLDALRGASTPVGGVTGLFTPPSQMLGELRVTAAGVQRSGSNNTRIVLTLQNESAQRGVGIAWKAVNSGGMADFWKFFPQAIASLEDDSGAQFGLVEVSGLGFARTSDDWTILPAGQSTTIVIAFDGRSTSSSPRYSLSAELRLAWANRTGPATPTHGVIFLNNIR